MESDCEADESNMKKRLKKKKISCKRRIRALEKTRKLLSESIEFQKKQIERQHRIIRKLGSKDGYEFLDTLGYKTIETERIKPTAYGNYVMISDDLNNQIIDGCEEKLVESLVRGLMQANVVQFIVKSNSKSDPIRGPLNEYSTVAAKILVVPWYEAVK